MNNRLGEININNFGSKMKIIEYINSHNITVEFENGYKTTAIYQQFKKGSLKSPYCTTLYDIGYLGEGKYKVWDGENTTIQYDYWNGILHRCYCEKYHNKYPTYKDVTCCKEWHNFQTFADWFDKNYYEVETGETMHLDKDILHKGNKIYSPDTCIFVPKRINMLFCKCDSKRGKYPIGVYWNKRRKKYIAQCSIIINDKYKRKHIGAFDSVNEAFKEYKIFKENYIKTIANNYKNYIPLILYDKLINYKVNIND